MKLIDAEPLAKFIEELFEIAQSDPCEGGLKGACTDILDKLYSLPITETKEIKYFDEDEKVWKIGSVIVDE